MNLFHPVADIYHSPSEPVEAAFISDQKISLSKKSFVNGESPPIFIDAAL